MIGSGRKFPLSSSSQQHRRKPSFIGISYSKDSTEENLDLFSNCRRSFSVASSEESDALIFDRLLTPPGTPMVPSSDGNESQPGLGSARNSSFVRSVSTTKSSRLSVSQSESNHPTRSTRSSSATCPSVSSSQYSTYSSKSTSILNTSSASIISDIRPSTPSCSSSTTRLSTPSARPSVPSSPGTSSIDKLRSLRPSTPTSRPQISSNLNFPVPRSTSRPSTPTRRNPAPSSPQVSGLSVSDWRTLANGRNVTSVSRPISPGSQVRSPSQPIVLPDFPHETPSNLRTTLLDKPLSAGRCRPSVKHTVIESLEPINNNAPTLLRRQSSPVVSMARVADRNGRARTLAYGKQSDAIDSQREFSTQKPVKTSTESTGFGRNISKKSLDMAVRHMG
ncbi:hypothetical protein Fot_34176 [Forsythia ovata]|uniref:Uncharacterized protein n=1 Tax=Forsythia ovata TaxID=205694 RepID=A0ABD1SHW5_9LAMI